MMTVVMTVMAAVRMVRVVLRNRDRGHTPARDTERDALPGSTKTGRATAATRKLLQRMFSPVRSAQAPTAESAPDGRALQALPIVVATHRRAP